MVEISDEVELDLGLSIGGSFRRSETSKPVERAFDPRRNNNGFDLDLREIETMPLRSNSSTEVIFANDEDVVSNKKREIHALRRQEAKKKQREKRCRSARNDSPFPESVPSHASESQVIISQDEGGEEEEDQRASKKVKMESNAVPNNNPINPSRCPVQFPYAPVHFVPYTRGFLYPCVNVMPCWTSSFSTPIGGVGGTEKSESQAMPLRGFRPFVAPPSFGINVSQKNGEVGTKTASDHDSPVCSSSTISDRQSQSSSQEGDGSRDTITHNSSPSSAEQNQPVGSSKRKDCDYDNKFQPEAQSPPPQTIIEDQIRPNTKTNNVSTETKANGIGKPPRPQISHKINKLNCIISGTEPKTTPFPQMPYVSTTGDGRNGKTVTGLLYRYNKSDEVSIVCVCHGIMFSPAEFVRHAGGTDVSHPLRHITVVPPAF